MLSAIRCPARACWVSVFCACKPRTRIGLSTPVSHSVSPTLTSPLSAVPVTTRPAPLTVNARSIARRKRCSMGCVCGCSSRMCWRRASIPSACVAAVTNSAAAGQFMRASRFSTSAFTSLTRASSTRSALVSATVSVGRPASWSRVKCSSVCAITPSSHATTSSAWSIPPTPASILARNFSWPGTSMKPITRPSSCGQ